MASMAKLILYLAFLAPSLLMFFMSVVYDKSFSFSQIAVAVVFFLIIFLVKG